MTKLITGIGLLLMIGLQLWLPASMIHDNTQAITTGKPYKFKTRPIDPTDPFRGKYVALSFEMDEAEAFNSAEFENLNSGNQEIYVYLSTDSEGYARATYASLELLDFKQDYVIAILEDYDDDYVYFRLPFDRFYMEESKAYEAEVAVRDASRNRNSVDTQAPVCYALVYINGDVATLDNVFIDETPLVEFVLENREEDLE